MLAECGAAQFGEVDDGGGDVAVGAVEEGDGVGRLVVLGAGDAGDGPSEECAGAVMGEVGEDVCLASCVDCAGHPPLAVAVSALALSMLHLVGAWLVFFALGEYGADEVCGAAHVVVDGFECGLVFDLVHGHADEEVCLA